MEATNPPFIVNLKYRDYVSHSELNQNKERKQATFASRDLNNQRKTPFFDYYDSPVKNSHLYPHLKTTFIKVYTPPRRPAKSQLLKDIEVQASRVSNKLQPRWE